ncbi:oligopeptide transport ATP-binding protein AppF [Clostridium pasteurianum DSM 525 = ATCC 6013]|uniref:Oligopeptide transport ATP-binding protein AppF n=2 Tax=Clostridium pasteurianum TaxID=1501 RepID=A0A0H3J5H7_CLOPA|nr:oligopeptide transport ATP-binding protein AppF [Clostridium pasteurianum DSM 525 = ATCC 6013]AJA51141.1 oligopeptide transport ATP-binding protein AppF [Clostridium pasteurianum DSM 525 = ATCC 6013]KRU12851.1 oligopeptide/dipeptide ABC transporter, ATPase subunit [Clostridium pasteurianum DSM 525 = ATCC 6013]
MMETMLEVKNLNKYFTKKVGFFGGKQQVVKAVDNVNLKIKKGETLGLVGESGCGKTTTGRTIARIYDPTAGNIIFRGQDIAKLSQKEIKPIRKCMQMIFQDPYASLNPRMTISEIIRTPLDVHNLYTKEERKEKVKELLNIVGFNSEHGNRYPHELSGGQRQRVGIARALAVEPEFIICDEPISALDVSIQAQIINTLEDLKNTLNLTYLFIAHDLSMVKHISDNIGVMYLGNIVETAGSDELYKNPVHPYTQTLLSAIPLPDPRKAKERKRIMLEGEVPSPINPPTGCKFHTRCKYAEKVCSEIAPELKDCGNNHRVACHLINKI